MQFLLGRTRRRGGRTADPPAGRGRLSSRRSGLARAIRRSLRHRQARNRGPAPFHLTSIARGEQEETCSRERIRPEMARLAWASTGASCEMARCSADICLLVSLPSPACPQPRHVPVLPAEVLHWLDPRPGQVIVDCTVGGGGHTRLIAERVGAGRPASSASTRTRPCSTWPGRAWPGLPVTLVHASFDQLPRRAARAWACRGRWRAGRPGRLLRPARRPGPRLSFQQDGPLDMRLDPTAASRPPTWSTGCGERDLADLIYQLRRGALQPADRPADRRGAAERSRSRRPASWPTWSGAACRGRNGRRRHRPGDADVPGAADRRQRRAGRAGPAAGAAAATA